MHKPPLILLLRMLTLQSMIGGNASFLTHPLDNSSRSGGADVVAEQNAVDEDDATTRMETRLGNVQKKLSALVEKRKIDNFIERLKPAN